MKPHPHPNPPLEGEGVAPRILLAPMEGLADDVMREVLTGIGGYDWCVCEFVRVSSNVLPPRVFSRTCPELLQGSRTAAGTPVRLQLMGCHPELLAATVARLIPLHPAGIDLNFGCPAPLVNFHGGGAALLDDPELLYRIAVAVRLAVPTCIPYTAKMRLGISDPARAVECALALTAGGVDELVVHGRTRDDFYRPPARYEWIARVREAVKVPVIANGEIWNVEDAVRCRAETGCADIMLGRGAVADPFLARRLRGETVPDWQEGMAPALAQFWLGVQKKVLPRHAPGRIKHWLSLMRCAWPQAEMLHHQLRPLRRPEEIDVVLRSAGVLAEAA